MMPHQAPAAHPWGNIPNELKALPQWCWASLRLWDAVDADGTPKREKKPLDPKVPGHVDARTDDPTTWGTFEQACARAVYENGGIGFVVTQRDPYVCVDLDAHGTAEQSAEHRAIIAFFAQAGAYVETSTRGKGTHVWMRRCSPLGPNLVRASGHAMPLEIYDRAHFLISTGNGAPVARLPELDWQVRSLYEQFAPAVPFGGEGVPLGVFAQGVATIEDNALLERCYAWDRRGLFRALHDAGDISAYRGDASSADLAYWSHLVFCARNGSAGEPVDFSQCDRIYQSARIATHRQGAYPRKAQRKAYVWSTFVRAMRDHTAGASDSVEAFVAQGVPVATPPPVTPAEHTEPAQGGAIVEPTEQDREETAIVVQGAPPGLVGEIAEWIVSSAFVPLPNLAVVTALVVAAGIVGRSFRTPLNDAVMLQTVYVTPSGGGKEHAKKAVTTLFKAVRKHCPEVFKFFGPSRFKSGQALRRVVNERGTLFSISDEFGEKMGRVWSDKSGAYDSWTEEILAIYGGEDDQGTAAAKVENDVAAVENPSFSLVGFTTARQWEKLIDPELAFKGVLPRMILIDDGEILNAPTFNACKVVSETLVTRMASVCNGVFKGCQDKTDAVIVAADPDVMADMKAMSLHWRFKYSVKSPEHVMASRIAQNTIRVATILAVMDFQNAAFGQAPTIRAVHWTWAKRYVESAGEVQIKRFSGGDTGTGDDKRAADFRKALVKYQTFKPKQRETYGIKPAAFADRVVTRRFFDRVLQGTCFTKDADKKAWLITRTIEWALADGLLTKATIKTKENHGIIGDAWIVNTEKVNENE
jgi:hypothetical protein